MWFVVAHVQDIVQFHVLLPSVCVCSLCNGFSDQLYLDYEMKELFFGIQHQNKMHKPHHVMCMLQTEFH